MSDTAISVCGWLVVGAFGFGFIFGKHSQQESEPTHDLKTECKQLCHPYAVDYLNTNQDECFCLLTSRVPDKQGIAQ